MSLRDSKFSQLFIVILCLVMSACGGGTNEGSSSSSGAGFSGDNLEGGAVTEISFNSSNAATISFGSVESSAEYVVALHSYSSSGSTKAYQIGTAGSLSSPEELLTRALFLDDENITEDFHAMLREDESTLDPEAVLSSQDSRMVLAAVSDPPLNDERSFNVLNSLSSSSTTSITTRLKYISDYTLVYIDVRNEDVYTSSELANIFDAFDARYATQISLFGTPPDIDENGKFITVLTQEVNELAGSGGGIVTGYFHAINQFSKNVYSQSNEADMLVGAIADPDGDYGTAISKSFMIDNIYAGLFFHEFQHMQNFNMHYIENNGSLETSSNNEGLSHLAEDLQYNMEQTGIENYARISGYLASIDSLCMTCGASLYQRGGIYLLLRYLYEQAEKGNLTEASSETNFINRITDTSETGVDNIVNAAYGNVSVDDQFRFLMGQFGLAVFLSNTGLSDDDRLNFVGLNLRSCVDDNRGTCLQGPAVNSISSFPSTDTLANSSISYTQLSGSEINELGGSVQIQFGSGTEGGGYLIQTGL